MSTIGCCVKSLKNFWHTNCRPSSLTSKIFASTSKMYSGTNGHTNGVLSAHDIIESAKKQAVCRAVEDHIKSGYVVGVGTGSTARYITSCLSEKVRKGTLKDIMCIPTSFQARHLINQEHLFLSDLERNWNLDVCIDGADEVDPDLNCIKGGGGCLTQEKIVMSAAKKFIIVADFRKKSTMLGHFYTRLPLEVVPAAYNLVKRRIEGAEGGECILRMAQMKAGPVITDSGNYVLDWSFPREELEVRDWGKLHRTLKLIPGIVETGLFIGVAEQAYFGMEDGSVEIQSLTDGQREKRFKDSAFFMANGHHK